MLELTDVKKGIFGYGMFRNEVSFADRKRG